ncbi:MAG: sigma-E factor negative regulatory protein [Betaproteobacteria bacterium]|nr:sigma-E factor negative regulatory protein [Betaproteobacteria bacterium]
MNEKLSALMDGELARDEAQGVIKKLGSDYTQRESWGAYHLIGACLRGDAIGNAGSKASPRNTAPKRSSRDWRQSQRFWRRPRSETIARGKPNPDGLGNGCVSRHGVRCGCGCLQAAARCNGCAGIAGATGGTATGGRRLTATCAGGSEGQRLSCGASAVCQSGRFSGGHPEPTARCCP